MSDSEILIQAENIGKKFCRSLKRSLWYGVKDIASDINPFSGNQEQETKHKEPALRADEFWALQNISFELRRGECLGLIGHNGAGKSTLLKILNGLIRPDTGRLTIRGRVGALIELSAGFNPILTGRENIYNRGALLGFSRKEIDAKFDAIVDFAEIGDFLDMPVRNYSSGMQVRLGFAVTAQIEPDVIIIDEVLAVGDLGFRFKCLNRISDLLRNSAVIFVSHSMPQVMRIATEIMVLKGGKSNFSGKDLGTGLDSYFTQFRATGIQTTGSGEIEVETLTVSTSSDRCNLGGQLNARHEEDLHFEISLKSENSITEAVIQLLFWNHDMIPVLDIADAGSHGFHMRFGSKPSFVKLTVPRVPLNSGKYHVSIIVTAPDLERVYCQMDHAASVTITSGSPASGAGCVSFGNWSQLA